MNREMEKINHANSTQKNYSAYTKTQQALAKIITKEEKYFIMEVKTSQRYVHIYI